MRPSNSYSVKLAALIFVGIPLLASRGLATGSTDNDGVEEFIRTHPSYRGYVTPHPPYPDIARMRHQEGTVIVEITFSKEGHVSVVKLLKSSGYRDLDNGTLDYIKAHWRSTFGQEKTRTQTLQYGRR